MATQSLVNPYKELPEIDTAKERLVPKGYSVLIRIPPVETKTSGGIIIADSAAKRQSIAGSRGILESIGPQAFDDKVGVRAAIGDTVIVPRYKGMDYQDKMTGDLLKLCNDDDIVGVVETIGE